MKGNRNLMRVPVDWMGDWRGLTPWDGSIRARVSVNSLNQPPGHGLPLVSGAALQVH